jgi:putative phosphoesterase
MVNLGVLADTHIPDRARRLNPRVLAVFRQARLQAILHAGDISAPSVLAELEQVAPVYAVRGNRDWVALARLPLTQTLTFGEVSLGMVHGHGRLRNYLVDKVHYWMHGYRLERYQPRLEAGFPQAQVIVFGHTHIPLVQWSNGRLLFNPGSPHFPGRKDLCPSVGLLHLCEGGRVEGEIVWLA